MSVASGRPTGDSVRQVQKLETTSGSVETTFLFETGSVSVLSTERDGPAPETCTYREPLLLLSLPLAPGVAWSDQGRCGDTTRYARGSFIRFESVGVVGVRLRAQVFSREIGLVVDGTEHVEFNETIWLSREMLVPLRRQVRFPPDAPVGGFDLHLIEIEPP